MRRDDALLLKMLLASCDTVNFARGYTFEKFAQDRTVQLAILKAVETVGRASSHVGADTKEAHPEIFWADISRMQHCFMDEKFNIELKQLWDTANEDIPCLIPQLERLVSAGNGRVTGAAKTAHNLAATAGRPRTWR